MSFQKLCSIGFVIFYVMACLDNRRVDEENEGSNESDSVEVVAEGSTQGDCFDGIDNDGDGYVDCNDFGCTDTSACETTDDQAYTVMTRVVLTLSDTYGHGTQDFTWEDPNGDGNSTVEDIVLTAGETYEVQVSIWNDLSDPSEEVTPEIIDEADEHQIFVTAPDFIDYSILDADSNGLDLGLEQEWVASAGTGTITIGLRHMPEEDGVSVKTADMDLDNLPGAWDFNIDFPIIVE